jgi:hypothetical protein
VLLKSFEVLFSTFSSSHIVNDWHMIIGEELVDDEDEDVLRTNFFSFAGSLLATILAVSCLYEEDEDKDTLGDMLLLVVVLAVVVMSGMVHFDDDEEDNVEA